jgi:hypothetical protein
MSNVSGSISVNVEFRDSTTSSGVQSLKTIALRETTEYTTGKVAIITGTAGTASVSLGEYGETPYRNSVGSLVNFSSIQRVVFSWSGSSYRELSDVQTDPTAIKLVSAGNRVAVSGFENGASSIQPLIGPGTGTGTYTIVLYGT